MKSSEDDERPLRSALRSGPTRTTNRVHFGPGAESGVSPERRRGFAGDAGVASPERRLCSAGDVGVASSERRRGSGGDAGVVSPERRRGSAGDAGVVSPERRRGSAGDTGVASPERRRGSAGDVGVASPERRRGSAGDAGVASPERRRGSAGDVGVASPERRRGSAGGLCAASPAGGSTELMETRCRLMALTSDLTEATHSQDGPALELWNSLTCVSRHKPLQDRGAPPGGPCGVSHMSAALGRLLELVEKNWAGPRSLQRNAAFLEGAYDLLSELMAQPDEGGVRLKPGNSEVTVLRRRLERSEQQLERMKKRLVVTLKENYELKRQRDFLNQ